MEKYTCPKCGKTTYTAFRDIAFICPDCNTEKLLIFNPKAFNLGYDFSDAKIIFDRRNTNFDVDAERREEDNREYVPIAWLVIKQNSPEKNIA